MSESTPLHYFAVFAPDYTEEETFERRMSVRERHFVRANEHIQKGDISENLFRKNRLLLEDLPD
jgi:hypothetical protein